MSSVAGPDAPGDGVLRVSILGRRFEARGVSRVMAEWLRAHWCFPEHDGHAPASRYVITLEMGRRGSPHEGAPAHRRVREGSRGASERDSSPSRPHADEATRTIAPGWRVLGDDVWEAGTPDAGVRLALGSAGARIHAWRMSDSTARAHGSAASALHAELAAALHLALCEAVRASGLLPLHAAVAMRDAADGRATAFVAPSGTGKSTTLVRLMRAGWAPIAEDFAWLDPETLVVYGWDRGIRLWPEGHALLGDAAGERWRAGPDGKLFLDYAALGAAAGSRRGVLGRLALLVRNGSGGSAWEALAPPEAVRALWEATGVPLSPRIRERVARRMPGLLARVEARRLRLGHGPVSL